MSHGLDRDTMSQRGLFLALFEWWEMHQAKPMSLQPGMEWTQLFQEKEIRIFSLLKLRCYST
uniref:Uncharacterized protein n=1 Tax=Anguilla anguilla TaxID=7936 RepID=A0A0E9W847_ANGAN